MFNMNGEVWHSRIATWHMLTTSIAHVSCNQPSMPSREKVQSATRATLHALALCQAMLRRAYVLEGGWLKGGFGLGWLRVIVA